MREIYLLSRRKASTNLCDSMTYLKKSVPSDRAFVLDKKINTRLELPRLTRCTRRTTHTSEEITLKLVLPEADSRVRNRVCTPNRTPLAMREHPLEHPDTGLLERFMRGELSGASDRPECRKIVRHLLAGCPQCARITGRLWMLGEQDEPLVD